MKKIISTMLRVKEVREGRRIRELQAAKARITEGEAQLDGAKQRLEEYQGYRERRTQELMQSTMGKMISPNQLHQFNSHLKALDEKEQGHQQTVTQATNEVHKLYREGEQAEKARHIESRGRLKYEELYDDVMREEKKQMVLADEAQQEEQEELRR